MSRRILVISLPKAGTYLSASILEKLGYTPTHWHISADRFEDYSRGTKVEQLTGWTRFSVSRPIEETVSHIPVGAFAVGHLTPTARCIAAVANIEVCFLVRELRASLVSLFNFEEGARKRRTLSASGNDLTNARAAFEEFLSVHGRSAIDRAAAIARWPSCREAPVIRFEDIRTCNVVALNSFGVLTGCSRDEVRAAFVSALAGNSLTKSHLSIPKKELWTSDCERIFVGWGGDVVNYSLGYGDIPRLGRRIRRMLIQLSGMGR